MSPFERAVPAPILIIAAIAATSHSARFSIVLLALLAAGAFVWWVDSTGEGPS